MASMDTPTVNVLGFAAAPAVLANIDILVSANAILVLNKLDARVQPSIS